MNAPLRVLVVEDEPLLSDVYSLVLTHGGYDVATAGNGLIGLKMVASFHPTIILLDLLMPKMDGLTFLQTFDFTANPNTKIIVYSNLYDNQKERQVRELGAVDIILKSSMTPSGLVELVRSHAATQIELTHG